MLAINNSVKKWKRGVGKHVFLWCISIREKGTIYCFKKIIVIKNTYMQLFNHKQFQKRTSSHVEVRDNVILISPLPLWSCGYYKCVYYIIVSVMALMPNEQCPFAMNIFGLWKGTIFTLGLFLPLWRTIFLLLCMRAHINIWKKQKWRTQPKLVLNISFNFSIPTCGQLTCMLLLADNYFQHLYAILLTQLKSDR